MAAKYEQTQQGTTIFWEKKYAEQITITSLNEAKKNTSTTICTIIDCSQLQIENELARKQIQIFI